MSKKWRYMDIHTHILPGVDDGSESLEESLKMVELAYQEGIRILIATPHYGKWNPGYRKEDALKKYKQLRQQIELRHKDMKIFMGNEIYYAPGVIEDLREGRASTLGGTDYVLVEFSTQEDSQEIENGLRSLVTAGYRPVLAHVERYESLRDLRKIEELEENGVYVQVNARSFLGGRFDKRAAWVIKLFQSDFIHFIASDCHNCDFRGPIMEKAVEKLLSLGEASAVERIVKTNVVKLAQNKYI